MSQITPKKLYRIIDANFNRAKEGLRVCEDICRFVWDQKDCTRRYKLIRHQLTQIVAALDIEEIVKARDIEGDIGRGSVKAELRRRDVKDIFYANSQRVKESVRVLEEFTKLMDGQSAQELKMLRYQIYGLEKKIIGQG